MKLFFILLLAGNCGVAWAQTNAPAKTTPDQKVEITSDSLHFDGNTKQVIYLGHVFVTDNVKAKLHCDQLTVNLPPNYGHPTNIVAESHVVVDLLDGKGQTNHVTSDRAVYTYSVINSVTNETVTFTGGQPMPQVENPQGTIMGEPLVLDVTAKTFDVSHAKMVFKQAPNSGGQTNGSPFNFLK